jgi:outer membrane receptor protein involved in Fe transport
VNLLDKKCGLWAALVLRCRAAHLLPAIGSAAVASLLVTAPAYAQGTSVLTGTVVDTATKKPLGDVVVTVTSPDLQGEQTVVTDKSGSYRIPSLPVGTYTLRLEGDGYKPFSRGGIKLSVNSTIRVNAELLPEGIKAEEVVVVGKAPTVDVGSSSTGVTLNQDFVSRIALNPPGGKAAASRSFESLAGVAPGAQADTYGVSIAGTTSPENAFQIDGVAVNDPAFGILGTPLSVEFVKEVGVITGGYMPEYGKAMGGIFDVVTKTGSNEFHGSVFFNITPGSLEGHREQVKSAASTITTNPSLGNLRDFGADIGGPILKDKLWFYAGVQFAFTRQRLERTLSEFLYQNDPDPTHMGGKVQQVDADGFPVTRPITCPASLDKCPAGLQRSPISYADETAIQYIGKLTYLINADHNLTLSVYGTPTRSGGNGYWPFDNTGTPAIGNIVGSYNSIGGRYVSDANDVSLKYSGAFNNKRQLLDITFGWHHQHQATLAADGSGPDDTLDKTKLASQPAVSYRRNQNPDYHSLGDFEPGSVPAGFCKPVQVWDDASGGLVDKTPCPVTAYRRGGPGFIDDINMDSYQGKAVFTNLLQAAGHHVIKAGVDFGYNVFKHTKAYSGTDFYRENVTGTRYDDFRQYGFMQGPDDVVILPKYTAKTTSISVGAFVQDSWQILDKVTLNFGVRYDSQVIYGADGSVGLALPNQWSPRVGVIYDFTQQGRSKLFASFARYYEGVPLDMADRSFPSEPQANSRHRAASDAHPERCDPTRPADLDPMTGACRSDDFRVPNPVLNSPANPNQLWTRTGGSKEAVDPDISPQSSDEFQIGGEYEVFSDARIGLSYTHRYLNKAMEDMSRDEANTYFIGNPGYGIAKDFPKATRNYDALNVYFTKTYSNTWLVQASYTLSRLYGNYAGLFRPETGQLDPNINSDFDLRSLLPNRTGALPGDRTHQIKIYGAKDFLLPGGQDILLGLTFRTRSGAPLNALGSHPLYGADEVYIVPRGQGGSLNKDFSITQARGDWLHTVDLKVGYSVRLNKDAGLSVSMDIFNLFGFQGVAGRDQSYTTSDVQPCTSGKVPACIKNADGTTFDPKTNVNPNYGKPTAYQDPRQFRFGAKVTF